jgi:hypothetical protein
MGAHIHEDPSRTTPIGLARYAEDFLRASLKADDGMGGGREHDFVAPIPVLYLAGHSIELALKAFLLHKGVTLRDLRVKYGHDLGRCFKKAKELGLLGHAKFEDVEVAAFEVLDDLYSSKQLEYIATGAKTFPMFGPIESFAKTLNGAIAPLVGYAR